MQPDDKFRLWPAARDSCAGILLPTRLAAIACALIFTLSISIALGWARVREASAPAPTARVAVWVSDRDGDQVIGLDRNLLLVRTLAVRAPTEIEARSDGGAWVVSSTNADPLGRHQLLRLAADGQIVARAQLAPVLDLACDDADRAALVDFDGSGERVRVFDAGAVAIWERRVSGALCAAARGALILVGSATGELALFDMNLPNATPLRFAWGGAISDVQPGPTLGTWWALDSHGTCRLALFDAALSVSWSRSVGLHALHLAPQRGVERVWVADTTETYVRRFGPGGALEVDRSDMPLGGLDRACATAAGSALFTAPGALLALDPLGQNAPGQAGFDFLVDVSCVP